MLKLYKFPTTWCPGCGVGLIIKQTAKAMDELKLNKNNTVAVSGIGCTGRGAGYFNLDSVHGAHGRALPLAEGVKATNPKLNVIVFSGDGDLTGIGGNHLLHGSRRDADLTVICNTNRIYGMTGGQMAPTTMKGVKTTTSPYGSEYEPINVQGLCTLNKKHFYARTSVFHHEHMKRCIKEAIQWKGFAFVEVLGICLQNFGRRLGFKTNYDMMIAIRDKYKINNEAKVLKENELGIMKKK